MRNHGQCRTNAVAITQVVGKEVVLGAKQALLFAQVVGDRYDLVFVGDFVSQFDVRIKLEQL